MESNKIPGLGITYSIHQEYIMYVNYKDITNTNSFKMLAGEKSHPNGKLFL